MSNLLIELRANLRAALKDRTAAYDNLEARSDVLSAAKLTSGDAKQLKALRFELQTAALHYANHEHLVDQASLALNKASR